MASLTASQQVGEILKSPDDLTKLPSLRKRLDKENVTVQAQLSNAVRDQLAATRDGLRRLVEAREAVDRVEREIRAVERLVLDDGHGQTGDGKTGIAEFRKISRVSFIHRNLAQTTSMVQSFQEISEKVSVVSSLLASDIEAGVYNSQHNLLIVHYQLIELEQFKNETIHQAKKTQSDRTLDEVQAYFQNLDQVLSVFEQHLWEMVESIIDIVRQGRTDTVVKILKIVEAEGREDEKAAAMKLIKRAKGDVAARFKSMQAEARQFKHYRQKLLATLRQSISNSFDEAFKQASDDPSTFIENLGWVYQDLIRIESDVVSCFPPDYNIYAFFVKQYHINLDARLRTIVASAPDASVLLQLHAWVKEYKVSMKQLEIDPDWTDPPLLDGKEQELIDDYVGVIVRKMDEWTANLMRDEEQDFIRREQPPEVEEGGAYALQGAVIMFQMVNQQIDLAADSGQAAVLARVVTEAVRVMRSTQLRFLTLVQAEIKKNVERPEESPPGLVEYVMALANDQIKSADFADALSARLEPIVSDKYKQVIVGKVSEAIDGYLDIAKHCSQALLDMIFHDLRSVTKLFFAPEWYNNAERPMPAVVETLRDYLSDYQEHLNSSIFDLLLNDLVETFLVLYLSALRRTTKFKLPAAIEHIRDDIGDVIGVFAEFKPREELEVSFELIEMVLQMLDAGKEMFFLDYWSFAKVHGPNLSFVEALLKARDNLDRSSVNEIMEKIRKKVKEEGLEEPQERTVMNKIAEIKGESIFASFGFGNLSTKVLLS
ncbi:Exocyst complex subunit SEC6 [Phaffia rhodozyma]|uniref:Exocyst complex subunit SEC6 n=1 Tax=Phaffia rhodozyma TaxID=264483 RepID=A0A0F7SGZ6_PHARH|nr:Exocyst complex subunit SEC6 [Phaffia rhodozyma]